MPDGCHPTVYSDCHSRCLRIARVKNAGFIRSASKMAVLRMSGRQGFFVRPKNGTDQAVFRRRVSLEYGQNPDVAAWPVRLFTLISLVLPQMVRAGSSVRHGRGRYVLSHSESHVCTIASRRQRDANAHVWQFGHCGQIRGSNRPFGAKCAVLQRSASVAP